LLREDRNTEEMQPKKWMNEQTNKGN
jgi:hypothetical protein